MRKPYLPFPTLAARFVAELAVIVLGVLIALAAQSWWEDRALEEDRRKALELLRDDVARLEEYLGEREEARQVSEALRWILATPLADLAATPDSVLGSRLGHALWSFGFQIGDVGSEGMLPSYADLKGSGRLHLLPDTVRALMPEVERGLADFSGFMADLVAFQQMRVDEILLDDFALDGRAPQREGAFAFIDPAADLAALKTRRAQTLLALKESLISGILDEAQDVVVRLGRLSAAIASASPDGGP